MATCQALDDNKQCDACDLWYCKAHLGETMPATRNAVELKKKRGSARTLMQLCPKCMSEDLRRPGGSTKIGDQAEVDLERCSFDACCSAIDIILMAKRQLLTMPEAGRFLKRARTNFMQRQRRPYGTTHLRF